MIRLRTISYVPMYLFFEEKRKFVCSLLGGDEKKHGESHSEQKRKTCFLNLYFIHLQTLTYIQLATHNSCRICCIRKKYTVNYSAQRWFIVLTCFLGYSSSAVIFWCNEVQRKTQKHCCFYVRNEHSVYFGTPTQTKNQIGFSLLSYRLYNFKNDFSIERIRIFYLNPKYRI